MYSYMGTNHPDEISSSSRPRQAAPSVPVAQQQQLPTETSVSTNAEGTPLVTLNTNRNNGIYYFLNKSFSLKSCKVVKFVR